MGYIATVRQRLATIQRWSTRKHIRLYNLALAVLSVGAGVFVYELVYLGQDARNLVAGALLAGGIGVAFAEITTTSDRRRLDDLRREIAARCRAAYRLGEFSYNFQAAAARGATTDRDVEAMIATGESIGISRGLVDIAREAQPAKHDVTRGRIMALLQFAGDDLLAFFQLGTDMFAIRSAGKSPPREVMAGVLDKVRDTLVNDVADYLTDDRIVVAWENLCQWWRRGNADDGDVQNIATLVHGYFLVLGASGETRLGREAAQIKQAITEIARAGSSASANSVGRLAAEAERALS